ncbi:unnamed protein product [Amoebophrya sp. A25]|nr:unnamed protein product [Amoebophrya sp. A25]|eukprot:GSA25T00010927001.1
MLNQKYPEVLDWGRYLDKTSTCRPFVSYTWGKAAGHPQPDQKKSKLAMLTQSSQYPYLGPKYKLPTNLPGSEDEISLMVKSHCSRDGVSKFPKDGRFSAEGVIKGLVQRTSATVGPGHYEISRASKSNGTTFAKAIETPDQVRARSVSTAVPPPGTYDVKGIFDYSDDEEEDMLKGHSTSTAASSAGKKH